MLSFIRIRIVHQSYRFSGLRGYPFCSHQSANMCRNLNLQAHNFTSKSCKNSVSLYLQRARLIDRIRIILRSNCQDSLVSVLNDPALDSFVVANALKSAPSPDSALFFIETLKKSPNFAHNQNTLYALAKILAKARETGKLKALINGINSGKFRNVARVSFMDQMKLYAAAGDLDSVLSVWHEYRVSQKRPNIESYNIIISICAQMGKDYEAVTTFHRMIDENGIPNSRTYTVVIEHLVKSGKLNSAIKIFYLLPLLRVKHTLWQYAVLVDAFCGVHRFDVVKTLLTEMQVNGILPNRGMYSSLQRMHDAGFVEETSELIKEMSPDERIKNVKMCSRDYYYCDDDEDEPNGNGEFELSRGVKLRPWFDPAILASSLRFWRPEEVSSLENANFIWTIRLVSKMIRSFHSAEPAWRFFIWVASQPGFSHDVYTISKMITKLAFEGNVNNVEELISMIKTDGIKLSYKTIVTVIDYYGISGKGEAALNVFRNVKLLCGELPKNHLLFMYSSILRTFTKCKMNSTALDLLDEMILSGIIPKIQTFSDLMRYFAVEGDIKTVQRLFGMVKQSGIEPDGYMFKVLISTYCNSNRGVLAFRAFEDMKSFRLEIDVSTKRLLVKSLWKEGKLREAAIVEETTLEVNHDSYNSSVANLRKVYGVYSSSFSTIVGKKDLCEEGSIDS